MNSQPGAKEILALLETLKNTVRDFVAREEKLNNDFRAYSAAAQNELVARNEQQESAVSAQFSNAEAILETQTERHRALFERRRDPYQPRPCQPQRAGARGNQHA